MGTEYLYVDDLIYGISQWTKVGSFPYLDAEDEPTNYIWTDDEGNAIGDFHFHDSIKIEGLESIILQLKCKADFTVTLPIRVYLDEAEGAYIDLVIYPVAGAYAWKQPTSNANMVKYFQQYSQLNNLKFRIMEGSATRSHISNCDGFDDSRAGWTRYGASPYLSYVDYPANYIRTKSADIIGDFTFPTITLLRAVTSVKIIVTCKMDSGDDDKIVTHISDGIGGEVTDEFIPPTAFWEDHQIDVTTFLNTTAKINACKIWFEHYKVGGAQWVNIDRVRRIVLEKVRVFIDCARLKVDFIDETVQQVKSPTDNEAGTGGWNQPSKAYVADNLASTVSVDGRQHIWKVHGLSPPSGVVLNKVFHTVKHKEAYDEEIRIRYSWDGGSTWSAEKCASDETSYEHDMFDITGLIDWDEDKLSDAKFRYRLELNIQPGGGCFAPDTLILMWDGTWKRIDQLHPDDEIVSVKDRQLVKGIVEVLTKHECGKAKDMKLNHYDYPDIVDTIRGALNLTAQHYMGVSGEFTFKEQDKLLEGDRMLVLKNFSIVAGKPRAQFILTRFVREAIRRIYKTVYNIQTNPPVFFANGIFVHNAVKIP